jgi:hypothetical protein
MSSNATAQTFDAVRAITGDRYKYGFVTDIASDTAPPGLSEETVRFISAKKREPDWLLDWRLQSFRQWQSMAQPEWAHRADRLSGRDLLLRAEARKCAEVARRGRSRAAAHL